MYIHGGLLTHRHSIARHERNNILFNRVNDKFYQFNKLLRATAGLE